METANDRLNSSNTQLLLIHWFGSADSQRKNVKEMNKKKKNIELLAIAAVIPKFTAGMEKKTHLVVQLSRGQAAGSTPEVGGAKRAPEEKKKNWTQCQKTFITQEIFHFSHRLKTAKITKKTTHWSSCRNLIFQTVPLVSKSSSVVAPTLVKPCMCANHRQNRGIKFKHSVGIIKKCNN